MLRLNRFLRDQQKGTDVEVPEHIVCSDLQRTATVHHVA